MVIQQLEPDFAHCILFKLTHFQHPKYFFNWERNPETDSALRWPTNLEW